MEFKSPLPGIKYELAWGPWAGTHRPGQNWQSGSAWDLLVPEGLPVVSPITGRVVSTGDGGSGRFAGAKVGISNNQGSVFLTHLSRVIVREGDMVEAGEKIGYTGQANGVQHLHIALGGPNYFNSADSNGRDPKPYLVQSSTYVGKGPNGYPQYRGNVPFGADANLTFKQRLDKAGYGEVSQDQIVDALKSWPGGQPGPNTVKLDPVAAGRLKKAGFGAASIALIIAALIRARRKK